VNPFGKEPPLLLKGRHQQKLNSDSISRWAQQCIDDNAIRRPTESDSLGTRVANEHIKKSYIAFCEQHGIRPENSDTFGKACVQMFGLKQRLTPNGWKGPRPHAYDVPTAEEWQKHLDARAGTPQTPEDARNPFK
jgi:hypothetical protein